MTITGGVAEQRIFGDYGPAAPATVLATLINGTGANRLLRQDPVTGAPIELVLTQRAGGAPGVNPNGPGFDDSPFPPENPQPAPAAQDHAPSPNRPVSRPSSACKSSQPALSPTEPAETLSPPPPGLVGAPTRRPEPRATPTARPQPPRLNPSLSSCNKCKRPKPQPPPTAPAATPPTSPPAVKPQQRIGRSAPHPPRSKPRTKLVWRLQPPS